MAHCAHTCFLQTSCASSHVGLKEKDVVVTSRSPEAAAPAETAHPEATPEGSAQRTHWQYNCEHSENYRSSQKDYYSCLWARTDTAVRCVVSSSSHGHTAPIMFHSPVTEIWSNGCMHLQHYSKVPHLMVCAGSMQTRGGPCQGQRNTADVVWIELDCIHTQLLPMGRYLLHLCSQACQYVDANGCASYSHYLYSTFKTKGSPECVTIIQ